MVAGDTADSPFDGYTGATPIERRLQWTGTRDLAAFLAVPAAIGFQRRHGWEHHRVRCHVLACETRARIAQRNGLAAIARDADVAQMVPIPVQCDDPQALRRHLFDAHRIEIAVTQHGRHSLVRLSVQAYNAQSELDLLVQSARAVLAKGGGLHTVLVERLRLWRRHKDVAQGEA